MKLQSILACCALAFTLAAPTAQAGPAYSAVVSFGDSLSDTGNVFAVTGSLGGPAVPDSPYFPGRFSNGQVAPERLAQRLGVPLVNFAFGGATSGLTNGDFTSADPPELYLTGVKSQVQMFAASLGPGGADPLALYMVGGGSNDFLIGDLSQPDVLAGTVIGNLTEAVFALYGLGARQFLLPLLPDLGLTPAAAALGGPGGVTPAELSALMATFDATLASAYASLQALLPDANLMVFDTFAAQHQVIDQAAELGLTELSAPCFSGSPVDPGTVCASPDAHFYWDQEHPTARVHQVWGDLMAAQVPEPAPIGLLLVASLAALRHRRAPRPLRP